MINRHHQVEQTMQKNILSPRNCILRLMDLTVEEYLKTHLYPTYAMEFPSSHTWVSIAFESRERETALFFLSEDWLCAEYIGSCQHLFASFCLYWTPALYPFLRVQYRPSAAGEGFEGSARINPGWVIGTAFGELRCPKNDRRSLCGERASTVMNLFKSDLMLTIPLNCCASLSYKQSVQLILDERSFPNISIIKMFRVMEWMEQSQYRS